MADAQLLWRWNDLVAAAGGAADGPSGSVTGVSIDTRTLEPGDVFVALKAERDGHAFVPAAFARGADAAIVARGYARAPGDGALIRVDDPLRALERIGAAARARLGDNACVVAVTGSAG
jgi:UDP-N-acetylmuramoyl-tripeptide--D-alanyl-D-alanine ligase